MCAGRGAESCSHYRLFAQHIEKRQFTGPHLGLCTTSTSPPMPRHRQLLAHNWCLCGGEFTCKLLTCITVSVLLLASPLLPVQGSGLHHILQSHQCQMQLLCPSGTGVDELTETVAQDISVTYVLHLWADARSAHQWFHQLWNKFSLRHPSPHRNSHCNSTLHRYYVTPSSAV